MRYSKNVLVTAVATKWFIRLFLMKPGTRNRFPFLLFSFTYWEFRAVNTHVANKAMQTPRGLKLRCFANKERVEPSLTIDSDLPRGLGNTNESHGIQTRLCREGQGSRQRFKFYSSCQETLKKHITHINPFMIYTYIFMLHTCILIPCITSAKLSWFILIYS